MDEKLKAFYQEEFGRMTEEELRGEIRRERKIRTTPPTQKEKKEREGDVWATLLRELEPGELREMLGKKKGGT